MGFSNLCGLGCLHVILAALTLAPLAGADCIQNPGGICSGNPDYTIYQGNCGQCGGSVNAIAPDDPNQGYGNYWFPYQCQTVCCGEQADMLSPPEGDGSCVYNALRGPLSPQDQLAYKPSGRIFLLRQCDSTYAVVELGAEG